jgi:hypothetical protein
MDANRFDTLARALAASRRTSRKTLLGTGLGLLLVGHHRDAAAGCKKVGKKCDKNKDCCDGATCKGKKCKCKSGREECSGKCFNLDTDAGHCGGCTACAEGQSCCSGECADLPSDRDHCGSCGNRCPGICTEGPNGVPECHGPRCCGDGQCVEDVLSNPDHCGACGRVCVQGETCCDGECVDLYIDPANCGSCGTTCDEFSPNCVGFCTGDAGCPAGADPCAGVGSIACGGDCVCSQSTEGATLCGDPTNAIAECGQCESSSDCASFGPGFFCMTTGTEACCGGGSPNVCRRVCTD